MQKTVQIAAEPFPVSKFRSRPATSAGGGSDCLHSVILGSLPKKISFQILPPDVVYFLKFYHALLMALILVKNVTACVIINLQKVGTRRREKQVYSDHWV